MLPRDAATLRCFFAAFRCRHFTFFADDAIEADDAAATLMHFRRQR